MATVSVGKHFKKFFNTGGQRRGRPEGSDVEARMVCAYMCVFKIQELHQMFILKGMA